MGTQGCGGVVEIQVVKLGADVWGPLVPAAGSLLFLVFRYLWVITCGLKSCDLHPYQGACTFLAAGCGRQNMAHSQSKLTFRGF